LGFVLSAEVLYNRNVNEVIYFDANLEPATGQFSGPDNRPRFPASGLSSGQDNAVRINDNVSRAVVLSTTNGGYYKAATIKLEYPSRKGIYGMVAHTISEAKDFMSAGSIASGSWTGVRSVDGNNNLRLSWSDQDAPSRTVGLLGYRLEYGGDFGGATSFSIGYVGERRGFNGNITSSRFSYSYAGDMNGDRVNDNDLLYIPRDASELTFLPLTVSGTVYSPAEQAAAFDAFIEQDDYLKTRRGQYAERNGVLFPIVHRFDLSVAQEFFIKVGGKRNTIQLRADILNAGNLINSEWGLGNVFVNNRPVQFVGVTADGVPQYRMTTQRLSDGSTVLLRDSFVKSKTQFDVWTVQFGIRYFFN
jgi:hypothetical protein